MASQASTEALTLAFLHAHPERAARVLERLPAPEAAALFARVPARAGGPVLAVMLPPTAARVLGNLEEPVALGLLAAIGAQSAVAMLRHVAEPRRTGLIEGLPTGTALASRLLLGYLEDSVGGWVDPDVVAIAPDSSAGEALARVRRGGETEVEQVYAVDPEQHLLGIVELPALLRAVESSSIATLMHPPPAILAASAPLASVAALSGWDRASVLPVVERSQRLLGVLRRSTLRRALARAVESGADAGDSSVAGLLAQGYWEAVSGLAEAGLALLPQVSQVQPVQVQPEDR